MNHLTEKKVLTVMGICVVLFGLGWSASVALSPHKARPQTKYLPRDGDFEGAMAQARQLMTALQQNDWNFKEEMRDLMSLPDQIYVEDKNARDKPSFGVFRDSPMYSELAFVSSTYVCMNVQVVPGIEGVVHPEGRFLVGYKTGEIKWIPLADVRLLKTGEGADEVTKLLYPGMRQYDPSLPKFWGR